jgi:hypothetical protein
VTSRPVSEQKEHLAYLQSDADWQPPDENWAVYPWGSPPPKVPGAERCEVACLSYNVLVRCLKERGHEGYHVMHP